MKTKALIALALVLSATVALSQSDSLRPDEVTGDHLGQEVSVEGRVYLAAKSSSGIHLYFGADTSTAFQAIVLSSHLHNFRVDVEKKYSKRNVRVTGEVEEQEGKYYVRIREPKQIKVVARRRGTSR